MQIAHPHRGIPPSHLHGGVASLAGGESAGRMCLAPRMCSQPCLRAEGCRRDLLLCATLPPESPAPPVSTAKVRLGGCCRGNGSLKARMRAVLQKQGRHCLVDALANELVNVSLLHFFFLPQRSFRNILPVFCCGLVLDIQRKDYFRFLTL